LPPARGSDTVGLPAAKEAAQTAGGEQMGNRIRRPSAAMIVATLALVMAVTGVAAGLPGKNSVDSGDIKNGQVKRNDLNKKVKVRWARVNGQSGDVIDQSGGIQADRVGEGLYFVEFPTSTAKQGLLATNVDPADGNDEVVIHVRRCGNGEDDLQFCSPDANNNPRHVWIETLDLPGGNQDASFTLAALPR
jgi:hypothetical protein